MEYMGNTPMDIWNIDLISEISKLSIHRHMDIKYVMGYGKCPLPPLWIWSMECGKWNMENENCPLPPYWALL